MAQRNAEIVGVELLDLQVVVALAHRALGVDGVQGRLALAAGRLVGVDEWRSVPGK